MLSHSITITIQGEAMPAKNGHDDKTKNLSRLSIPSKVPEGWNTPRIASEQSGGGER